MVEGLKVGDKVKILSKSAGIPISDISYNVKIGDRRIITNITTFLDCSRPYYRLNNEHGIFHRQDLKKIGIDIL